MIKIDFSGKKRSLLQFFGDANELEIIRDSFSVPNPAYISKKKFIPARLYAITPSGRFDIGLLDAVLDVLKEYAFAYELSDALKQYLNSFKRPEFQLSVHLALPYRDYQEDAIENCVKAGNGVVLVGTGGGKTLLTAGLIENIRTAIGKPDAKVLITVPTLQLVEQTSKDFEEYGLTSITKWSGDNKLDHTAKIIVAGTQNLTGKNTDLSVLADVDIFIGDEVHVYKKANVLNKVFKFINTPYRFGLTGTMPSEKIDQWNIIGKFGKVLYEKKIEELKNEKHVSDFKIYILNIDHKGKTFSGDKKTPALKYMRELKYLITNPNRNNIISNLASKLDGNTVIMVDRLINGEALLKNLTHKAPNRPIFFIQGETEVEDREKIKNLMENTTDAIVISVSKIFSTGINIPNLHNIIFASAGKAKIKIIQSIGRSLRKHPTKKSAKIFDISDNTYYGAIHKEKRKELYTAENYPYVERNL